MMPTTENSLRILCADDNVLLGDVLVRLFSNGGHHIQHVADGLDAWELISRDLEGFDVLITDHQMPGLTGLELVELLRQTSFRGRIFVHSASLSAAVQQSYAGFGVDEIVGKGCRPELLLRAVEKKAGA